MVEAVLETADAVFEASVRVAPMLVVLHCLRPLGRRLSGSEWHILWASASFALLLVPLVRLVLPPWLLVLPGPPVAVLPSFPTPGGAAAPEVGTGEIIAWVWAVGAIGLLVRLGWGLRGVARRLANTTQIVDTRVERLLRDSAVALDFRREVSLRMTAASDSPAAWGAYRPVILLPSSAQSWSDERLRMVLVHELAHLRRGDALMRVVTEVAIAIHWFNPLVWTAARQLRESSERACDDAVLQAGAIPESYAQEIVDIVQTARRSASPALVPTILTGLLERRVQSILDRAPRRHPATRRVRTALLAAALVLTLPAAAVQLTSATPGHSATIADFAARHQISLQLAALIVQTAVAEGIDVELAFGLVHAESGFRAHEISRGGAIGLTQLLPSTAVSLDPTVGREQLLDPAINLRVGLSLLRHHLDRYQGDPTLALLAYHLGPGRLERIQSEGQRPPTEYVDRVLHPGQVSRTQ